jgi:Tol biopolymer transport system component
MMKVDGTEAREVITRAAEWYNYHSPAWSPEGKQISYVEGAWKETFVYFVNIDGTNRTLIPGVKSPVSWAPLPR